MTSRFALMIKGSVFIFQANADSGLPIGLTLKTLPQKVSQRFIVVPDIALDRGHA